MLQELVSPSFLIALAYLLLKRELYLKHRDAIINLATLSWVPASSVAVRAIRVGSYRPGAGPFPAELLIRVIIPCFAGLAFPTRNDW